MNFGASRLGFWFLGSETVSWTLTDYGLISGQPGGWVLGSSGRRIRFNIQDSQNCGGINGNVQGGTATASINTKSYSYLFTPTLTGVGEAQDSGYENMELYLSGGAFNNTLLVSSTSAGGGLGCVTSPVVQTVVVPAPHLLQSATTYTFILSFTTSDPLYHLNSYYECDLSFVRQ